MSDLITEIRTAIKYTEESVSCGTCKYHASMERNGAWSGECHYVHPLTAFGVDSDRGHCDRWEKND